MNTRLTTILKARFGLVLHQVSLLEQVLATGTDVGFDQGVCQVAQNAVTTAIDELGRALRDLKRAEMNIPLPGKETSPKVG